MTVPFNIIPQNVLVPLFYAEMDASQAGYFLQQKRTLLIGQKLAAGTQAYNVPVLVGSPSQAKALFGAGSMLARMHAMYRNTDLFGEVWCIAVADAGGGVVATGTATITGPATGAGTVSLYIAGQRIQVGVAAADTATAIATNIVAAVAAATDLPVTAANAAGVITFTSKWKGLTANDIQITDSYGGLQAGEALPAGVAIAYAAMSGGTTAPDLTSCIVAMGDVEYDYVIHPYTDSTTLNVLAAEMNDQVGRWSPLRQIYGHSYTAIRGISTDLVTFGRTRNDQHSTNAGFELDVQNPCWEYAAAYGSANAAFLNSSVVRPTQSGPLNGITPARAGKRFLYTERASMLGNGVATSYMSGGIVRVERAVTSYRLNTQSQADPSYLDSETLHTSAYVIRNLRSVITTKYPRHGIADDGTNFGSEAAIVTPSVVRGEMVALYKQMETDGIVENADLFAKYLIVERDSNNPNRMNMLFPPDYVNQLRVFAVLNQFRLQYPATA